MSTVGLIVYALRHGERADREPGAARIPSPTPLLLRDRLDPELTARGRRDARRTGAFLALNSKARTHCLVLVSPYRRCMDTAIELRDGWNSAARSSNSMPRNSDTPNVLIAIDHRLAEWYPAGGRDPDAILPSDVEDFIASWSGESRAYAEQNRIGFVDANGCVPGCQSREVFRERIAAVLDSLRHPTWLQGWQERFILFY